MAEIILAKIQHRRGRRADLPQPLLPGELGLCVDTGQLFIGLDPADNSMPSKLILESYSDITNSTEYANDILNNQLIVITGLAPSDNTYDDYGDYRVTVFRPQVGPTEKRIYVGYAKSTTQPLPGGEAWGYVGVHHQFVDGTLDLTVDLAPGTPPVITDYDLDDSGAIADIINDVFDHDYRYTVCGGDETCMSSGQVYTSGLVTVKYNMEIFTEYTEISITGDVVAYPTRLKFFGSDVFAETGIEYDISSEKATDSFKIDYSAAILEGGYSRVGSFTIAASNLDQGAVLQDAFVSLGDPSGFDMHFQAVYRADGWVSIQYKTVNAGNSTIAFSTMTKRWKSF